MIYSKCFNLEAEQGFTANVSILRMNSDIQQCFHLEDGHIQADDTHLCSVRVAVEEVHVVRQLVQVEGC